jgi:hypothetical protein
VLQATALEHRLGARGYQIGHLKRVQDRVRAHFNEGMPQAFLF